MSDSNSTVIRFCNKCQCDTERYNDGHCKPCARKQAAKWGEANKQKKKENTANWCLNNAAYLKEYKAKDYLQNSERYRDLSAKYYAEHQESAKAYAREKRLQNQDAAIARAKEWRQKNPEKSSASTKRWQAENASIVSIHKSNRRAKKRLSVGVLSTGLKDKLFTIQRGKCACCGLPLGSNYHLDHIMPLALGGPNTDDNIQLLRQRCNNQKHTKHPVDFMQERGFLL